MKAKRALCEDAKRALCEAEVTLDGRPARIAGTKLRFASVRTRDGVANSEWAWETVQRIVERGGKFYS